MMEIVLAIAVMIVALVLILSSRSKPRDTSGDDVVRTGREQASVDEQNAQKARADAVADHDAIFRNGPSGQRGRS
jgi:hypothetical protein